jgi:arabinofuranan 3-O-arabinosyltransferase
MTGGVSPLAWRFRLAACSVVLFALSVVQQPGALVGDTKLDLAVDPGGFLSRAAHLWDAQGAFGQVQNQAYGYLVPMGPFFWAGHGLGVPDWLVQRLWVGLVMTVAFLGVVRLCGVLGVGTPPARVVAGFAFALSPRMLTTLGPISVEAWPSALAPWVLVALVVGSRRGSPRRAAAWAAVAVALVGGVNAAAAAAVLPLGVLWLLTRRPGPRRRRLLLWWPVLTFLGTCWWLVPLLLLGRYSPPFLDFIESASVTTAPTTVFDALRGTSDWVPFIEPVWRAGRDLLDNGRLALDSGVVLALGFVGLARRDLPHRSFLVLGVLAGLVLVTAGHVGAVQGWFAGTERSWLDAALAPLRNVHKFDVVLRLPLVLGLAHVVGLADSRVRQHRAAARGRSGSPPARWRQGLEVVRGGGVGVLVLAVAGVAGAATPAWTGRLAPQGSFLAVPSYWSQTADWLAREDDGTRALLLPGSSFGSYLWGEPRDEPLQALARSPWAVRNAVPLAPAGNIRLLDAIEQRLVQGRGSQGLASYLSRAGVGWLVVRNDLERTGDVPDPVLVHQALRDSPGISQVARFGPEVGGPARLDDRGDSRVVVNQGWQSTYPAVEVFRVRGAHAAVRAGSLPVVAGGPEDLLDLADDGLLGAAPTRLAVDAGRDIGDVPWVLTDGLRAREQSFGRVHDGRSPTLAPGEGVLAGVPAAEYALPGSERLRTRARLEGARATRASSSASDANGLGVVDPATLPFAAFDAEPLTQWVSGLRDQGRAWAELTLLDRRPVATVNVTAGGALGRVAQRLQVRTDRGVSSPFSARPGERVTVVLPAGSTRRIRVQQAPGSPPTRLAVSDVDVPGVGLRRPLVLPRLPGSWGAPDAVVLTSGQGRRSGCVLVDRDWRCAPGRARLGEEPFGLDRVVRLPARGSYAVGVRVAPRDGTALEDLVQAGQLVHARASSSSVDAAVGSAVAAVDGRRSTTWVARFDDERPSLRIDWLRPQVIRSVDLRLDPDAAATPADRVTLDYRGGRQTVRLDARGHARLARAVRTTGVTLRLSASEPARSLGYDGTGQVLGLGVTELRLGGARLPERLSSKVTVHPCGTGPTLQVGDRLLSTAVAASPQGLLLGQDAIASVCGATRVTLPGGDTRIRLTGSPAFTGTGLVLRSTGAAALRAPVQPVRLDARSDVRRTAEVPAGASTLVVRENENPGWVGSGAARPVTVDGWQQGWRLAPGRDRTVTLTFAADRFHRVGLAGGGLLLVLLGAVACRRERRPGSSGLAACAPRAIGTDWLLPVGLVGVGLVGGWPGVLAAASGATLCGVARRHLLGERAAWLAGVPVAAAALAYAARPLGAGAGWAGTLAWPQLAAVVALGWLLVDRPLRRTPWPKRTKGDSTSR